MPVAEAQTKSKGWESYLKSQVLWKDLRNVQWCSRMWEGSCLGSRVDTLTDFQVEFFLETYKAARNRTGQMCCTQIASQQDEHEWNKYQISRKRKFMVDSTKRLCCSQRVQKTHNGHKTFNKIQQRRQKNMLYQKEKHARRTLSVQNIMYPTFWPECRHAYNKRVS